MSPVSLELFPQMSKRQAVYYFWDLWALDEGEEDNELAISDIISENGVPNQSIVQIMWNLHFNYQDRDDISWKYDRKALLKHLIAEFHDKNKGEDIITFDFTPYFYTYSGIIKE